MTDREVLKNHITDLANRSFTKNIYTNTNFLNLDEQNLYYLMANEINFVKAWLFGGNEHTERKIIIFGSREEMGYDPDIPITLMEISPKSIKFAEELSHRDYLGAILNLGIERELIGDIFIKEKRAWFYCIDTIATFLGENLTRVRHTDVVCRASEETPDIAPEFEEVALNVPSERLDAIVSAITNLSRANADKLFASQKVFVNSKITENRSFHPKEGDVISVRGFGKAIYLGVSRSTKKGRYFVKLKKYV